MGFLANPLVIKGIGAGASLLGGWLSGRHAKKAAAQRSPEEMQALAGAQGAATGLGTLGQQGFQQGTAAFGQGLGNLGQAGNYWQTLLGGNRAAMAQATAGPRGAITDQYRGAERGLERSGVRGGVRDLAMAELSRDRAGKIAGLTTGVQPGAAQQLAGIGGDIGQLGLGMAGLGAQATGGAGSLWSHLLGAGAGNRYQANEAGQAAAAPWGSIFFDLLSGMFKGGGKSPLKSRQTVPNSTTWMPGG